MLKAEQAKLGEKLADGLEAKLDAQLELEFKQWLNGVHPVNRSEAKDRRATVMDVIRDQGNNYNPAMDPHKNLRTFTHTWWRTNDLKHLPGVRDYLTTDEQKVREEKLKLAKLAHFGPQNVEEAWAYFKTFVKNLEEDPVAFDPTMSNYWRNYPALQGDDTDKSDPANRGRLEGEWRGRNDGDGIAKGEAGNPREGVNLVRKSGSVNAQRIKMNQETLKKATPIKAQAVPLLGMEPPNRQPDFEDAVPQSPHDSAGSGETRYRRN